MADRILKHPKIELMWNSIPEAIIGDQAGVVGGIQVKNIQTQSINTVSCKGVFLAIGHIPNTQIFKNILQLDDLGYIQSQPHHEARTNIEGVFVAGDCSDHVYRQAITAAGMGCKAAIEAERWLASQQ